MSYDFNAFVKEAERRNKKNGISDKPFELKLSTGNTITIKAPDATTFLALSDVDEGKVLQQFKILFGSNIKDYNALVEELDGKPYQLLNVILENAYDFWGAEVPAAGKSES